MLWLLCLLCLLWLYYSERIIIDERADLIDFSLIFVGKMCVFVSRPMKNVTFLRKNADPPKRVIHFPGKETHSETKSWKSSRILTKQYNNNGKPWKSSRILRVNPNFFIFRSFLSFLSIFSFFFFHHFFIFFYFLSFSFHFLSFSVIFSHVISCSFFFFLSVLKI